MSQSHASMALQMDTRTRAGFGKRKDTKRAIVTLAAGSKPIDLFGAPA